MKLLEDLVDNSKTDKNREHSYLPLYQRFFTPLQSSAKNILEIGIGSWTKKQKYENGGSVKLWYDFFDNANVYAIDIIPKKRVSDELFHIDRIHIFTEQDAYDYRFVKYTCIDTGIKFDVLIDDGPHT